MDKQDDLKVRSQALDSALSDALKCRAVELAVTLGNLGLAQDAARPWSRNQKGNLGTAPNRIRREIHKMAGAWGGRSHSVAEWKGWGREAFFWLQLAADEKEGGAEAVVVKAITRRADILRLHGSGHSPAEIADELKVKEADVRSALRSRIEEHPQIVAWAEAYEKAIKALGRSPTRTHRAKLEEKFRRQYTQLEATIRKRRLPQALRMVRYVRDSLAEHLEADFTRSKVSPIELAALGAALVGEADTTFRGKSATLYFQRRFGRCKCGAFFFRTESGKDPIHCEQHSE